jgi:hypothetical protein
VRAQLLTRLNVITLFDFTYVTKNNPAASVYYTDLVCSLKITLTGQEFEEFEEEGEYRYALLFV